MQQPLESLLDASYEAARVADFALLVDLIPALEAALDGFVPDQDRTQLARLQHKTARNAACFSAMGRGIRSAIRRLEEVRRAVNGLGAYDSKGQRLNHVAPEGYSRRF